MSAICKKCGQGLLYEEEEWNGDVCDLCADALYEQYKEREEFAHYHPITEEDKE